MSSTLYPVSTLILATLGAYTLFRGKDSQQGKLRKSFVEDVQKLGSKAGASLGQCIDLNSAYIARFKDNKSAAASYTFDDGYPSSEKIARIFEDFGVRATFYVVAGNVEATTGWDLWKTIAAKGHEVGNHSMTHTKVMSKWRMPTDTLLEEIVGAKALITEKLGRPPATFAFPWHHYSSRAMKIAVGSHAAVRTVRVKGDKYAFALFDQAHAKTLDEALSTANKQLHDIVESGGWFVAGGHGIDGDGWSPVTSSFLEDHLQYAATFSEKLWIDTFANIACYRKCRDVLSMAIRSQSPKTATIKLVGDCDPAWRTPVTVVIPMKASVKDAIVVRDGRGHFVDSKASLGRLQFNMPPGSEFEIELLSGQA